MDLQRIYKQLKNKKGIEVFYKKDENITYTIHLGFNRNLFQLHYYYLDGNEVFDENNYKDEYRIAYSDFADFIRAIEEKFPNIEINL